MNTRCIKFNNCVKITRYIERQIKDVEDLKSLVRQLTRAEGKEQLPFKIGVLNCHI
jgi:hypothetical protein